MIFYLSFICHVLSIITIAVFGLVYMLRREFMPYHAVALGGWLVRGLSAS
jgi:hypothetical protein